MADILITIGIALDQLQSGLQQANEAIEGFGKTIETLKGALAFGGATELVRSMAELGEEAERAAAILGISTVAAQELGVVSQTAGGSLESITAQLSRLQAQMERGTKSTSVQAAALKALGISAQDLLKTPIDQQMNLFADAVKRLGDQGINAAPALSLISRGLVQMMPTLSEGSARINELKQRAVEVGAVVGQDTTRALAELYTELTLATGALKGFGEVVVAGLSGSFMNFLHDVENAVSKLSALIATNTLVSFSVEELSIRFQRMVAFLNGDTDAVARLDGQLKQLNVDMNETVSNYQKMIAAAASAASKTPVKVQLPGADRDAVKQAEIVFKEAEQLYKFQAQTYQITQQEMTNDLIAALAKRRDAEIKAGEDSKVAQEKFKAEYDKLIDAMNLKTFEGFKSMADSLASSFSSALDQVLTKQVSFGAAMKQMFAKMIEGLIADLIKLIAEYAVLKAVAGTALAPGVPSPTLQGVAGAVFPALGGLLGGGASAAQTTALAANTTAVTANTAALTGHAAVTATGTGATAAHTAATVTQTGATGLQTGATVTGTAAVAANTVGVGAAATATIAAGVESVGAWVANTTATIVNTAATLASSGFGLMGLAGGAWEVGRTYGFPSYAMGTIGVPGTQLALLHAGEMVIPAAPAAQIRDGGAALTSGGLGGGDQNISLNISAMDGRSVANMLFNNRQFMQQLINTLARNNPSNASRLAGVV